MVSRPVRVSGGRPAGRPRPDTEPARRPRSWRPEIWIGLGIVLAVTVIKWLPPAVAVEAKERLEELRAHFTADAESAAEELAQKRALAEVGRKKKEEELSEKAEMEKRIRAEIEALRQAENEQRQRVEEAERRRRMNLVTTEVVMPQMGESIAEGTITKWLKQVGDRVERDEPLFEISTDKVDAEIPSPAAGVLTEIRFEEGETAEVNRVVAVLNGP